jgi:hypothetical protein
MAIKVSGEKEAKKKYHKRISSRGPRPLRGFFASSFNQPVWESDSFYNGPINLSKCHK